MLNEFFVASQISEVTRRNTPVEEYADATFFSPDFQDVVREYNSYSPDSEERKRFVQHRQEVVNDLYMVSQSRIPVIFSLIGR